MEIKASGTALAGAEVLAVEQRDLVVDLAFQLRGAFMPADHGYLLYSAVSQHLPWLHGDESLGIHPIRGQLAGQRQLVLTRESQLVLRLPVAKIPAAIRLAGQRLDLDGASLLVGVPTIRPLLPRVALYSRLVVIKGFLEPAAFLDAAQRQLAERDIAGSASLVPRRRERPVEDGAGSREPVVRRTLRIHDREVVGFAVLVSGLGPEDSIQLQTVGLGGRRRFGCGIFLPTPEPRA